MPDRVEEELAKLPSKRLSVEEALSRLPTKDQKVPFRSILASFVRPALEVGGATAGAVSGSGLGPAGTAVGGGLGFAAGRQAANVFEEFSGIRKPEPLGTQLARALGQDVPLGIAGELGGPALPVVRSALRPLGRGLARIGEGATGVSERAFRKLASQPLTLFTAKTREKAGRLLGEALKKEGVSIEPTTQELFDPALTTARDIAQEVFEKISGGVQVTVGDIIRGRRAVDRIIAGTSVKDKSTIRSLVQARNQLNELFEKQSLSLIHI